MKKTLLAIFSLILVLSPQAFAMDVLNNKQLSDVTGQSGISLKVDDLKMYLDFNGLWFTDTDGLEDSEGASWGLTNFSTMIHVNAITGYDSENTSKTGGLRSVGRSLQGEYDPDYDFCNYGDKFVFKPLTLDVTDTLPVLSSMATSNNDGTQTSVAGVQIGLATTEIVANNLTLTIGLNDNTPLDGSNDLNAVNKNAVYYRHQIKEHSWVFLDGNLEIAPH